MKRWVTWREDLTWAFQVLVLIPLAIRMAGVILAYVGELFGLGPALAAVAAYGFSILAWLWICLVSLLLIAYFAKRIVTGS